MVALEISKERRPSNHPPGNASVDPTFELRECPVECRNHPWTFGATRFRSTLPRHHQEVYAQDSGRNGQIPNLVDLPAKSPRSVLGNGLLHGPYSSLSNPLHLCDLESFPSPGRAFCCDGASHDGLGDPATAGSDAFWSTTQTICSVTTAESTETRWAGFSWELGLQKSKRPTGAPGKIHSWKGMEVPYGESCWIT